MLLEAPSALVLPPQIIELAGQSLDGSRDVPDIITGDRSLAIGGHGRRIGLALRSGQAVPLVTQAERVLGCRVLSTHEVDSCQQFSVGA